VPNKAGARRLAEPIAAANGCLPRQRRVVAAVAKEASSGALRLFGLPPQRPAGHLNARACTPWAEFHIAALPRKKMVLAAAWNADTQLNAREPRGGTRNPKAEIRWLAVMTSRCVGS